jgi:HEAT repeat protein
MLLHKHILFGKAFETGGEMSSQDILAKLISLLRDQDLSDGEHAIHESMRQHSSTELVDLIKQVLQMSEIDIVRVRAVRLLGSMGEAGIDVLASLVKHDIRLRQTAVDTLGETHSPKAFPHLIAALSIDSLGVKQSVASALASLPPETASRILETMRTIPEDTLIYLIRPLGALKAREAISTLLPLAVHPTPAIRDRAIEALGRIGESSTVQIIIEATNDPVNWVRRTAVYALGGFHGEDVTQRLIDLSYSDDYFVHEAVAISLGDQGNPASLHRLLSIAQDAESYTELRETATWQLTRTPEFIKEHMDQLPSELQALAQQLLK